MGLIRINATVYFAPGPWGANVPIQGASVEIWDKDLGNNDDQIFAGTTNASGHVDGMSSEWVDKIDGLPVWQIIGHDSWGVPKWGWVTPKIDDPSDARLLYAKISFNGNQIIIPSYPYVNDSINIPLVSPWFPSNAILKSQRALIVMSNLIAPGSPDYKCLYSFMDFAGISIAQNLLSNEYSSVTVLKDALASTNNLIQTIDTLSSNGNIKAIDVILNMHGRDEGIVFSNADTNISSISTQINTAGRNKLRMLYSTACFGSSHNDNWLNAGFKVTAGAKKVNANAMTEYPTVLTAWKNGTNFNNCISAGEVPVTRDPMDRAAKLINPNWDANSDKDVLGNGNITISTC